jgi:hypothetical protein
MLLYPNIKLLSGTHPGPINGLNGAAFISGNRDCRVEVDD